ncbi:hypothetical protein GCM10027590_44500 [Nocardiopsis nanhaiensis]
MTKATGRTASATGRVLLPRTTEKHTTRAIRHNPEAIPARRWAANLRVPPTPTEVEIGLAGAVYAPDTPTLQVRLIGAETGWRCAR